MIVVPNNKDNFSVLVMLIIPGESELITKCLHDCIYCEELRSASEFVVLPAANGLWGDAS